MEGDRTFPKICIIGAGISGMCAAIQIREQLQIESFTIFEERHDIGGSWLVNTYPGCGCDIPSQVYSYSFELNPLWSKHFAEQEEILEYLRKTADKYNLYSKVLFRHQITLLKWDEDTSQWHVTVRNIETGSEETKLFDLVVSAVGGVRTPNQPKIFELFKGPKMHTAEWDSSIQLKDKVVAVIGSGSSAVQIIPRIVSQVKRLISYQRRPAWVIPKLEITFHEYFKRALQIAPGLQRLVRNIVFLAYESHSSIFRVKSTLNRIWSFMAKYQLTLQIKDAKLREQLQPNYPFGCKRVTISNNYYPALCRSNVMIITDPIKEVTEDAIVTKNRTREKPDVIILATGFKVQDCYAPMKILINDEEELMCKWEENDGPCAYGGVMCHRTPNLFFLLGPNTGASHNSVVFSIECQVNWVVKVIQEMLSRNSYQVTVKESAELEYMRNIRQEIMSTVWGVHDCGSWYANSRGTITTLWPKSLISYYFKMRNVEYSHLNFKQSRCTSSTLED